MVLLAIFLLKGGVVIPSSPPLVSSPPLPTLSVPTHSSTTHITPTLASSSQNLWSFPPPTFQVPHVTVTNFSVPPPTISHAHPSGGSSSHPFNDVQVPVISPPLVPDEDDLNSEGDADLDVLGQEFHLLERFLASDQSAPAPAPCKCHGSPIGSCEYVKNEYVSTIVSLRNVPGQPANMDSLRIPLPRPSFPIKAWELALRGYFDADGLTRTFTYGWDFSFLSPPDPKDATRNLGSSKIAPQDIDTYVRVELQHGALIGPFNPDDLPFPIFHSPLGSVPKVPVRRTITDCSQMGDGINAFISAHAHRGLVWKLFLPTTKTIVRLIKECRELYPGQRLFMFKLDFSRWYRWFQVDPSQAIFFAIRWGKLSYLDAAMSFGNRASALCAQRTMWAVMWIFRTRISPQPGVQNSGIDCTCETHCSCGSIKACGYIDDSLAIAPSHLADHQFHAFIKLCQKLGLKLSSSPGHISPPAATCIALGLLYDLDNNIVSFPEPKLSALLKTIDDWLAKSHASE